MTAYYNERDPFAAQWLRNLIAAGHIAPGDVDERDIRDVGSGDLDGYGQVHLFAGIGTWSQALRMASWPDARSVWTGSCPCQPFSTAPHGNQKGVGSDSHLWPEMLRLLRERKPTVVLGEQVARKAGLEWLDVVRRDLEQEGYAFGAANLCGSALGFPRRDRLYFVAHSNREGERLLPVDAEVASVSTTAGMARGNGMVSGNVGSTLPRHFGPGGRLRAYGNAIVAPLAAEFIGAVMECL